jgi:hypothetical protein
LIQAFFYYFLKVLGVSPIVGFEKMKMAYRKKRIEAERRGDDEFLAKVGFILIF